MLITDDEELLVCQAVVAVLLTGILSVQEAQNARRHVHRLYLCRAQLLPNPWAATPWQALWHSQDDWAFITTMGLDVSTFHALLEGPGHFAARWVSVPIPCEDVSTLGQPRIVQCSLDAVGTLGLVLHYLGSAMLEISLQQIFALTPSTLSHYLEFAHKILFDTLQTIPDTRVNFPQTTREFEFYSNLIRACHPMLEGAFGSIDGLSLSCQESNDPEMENSMTCFITRCLMATTLLPTQHFHVGLDL
ncbi:hypothetical protein JOM56_012194 [Amanita muscaria]